MSKNILRVTVLEVSLATKYKLYYTAIMIIEHALIYLAVWSCLYACRQFIALYTGQEVVPYVNVYSLAYAIAIIHTYIQTSVITHIMHNY